MSRLRGRSPASRSRRLVGVGAGVLLVTLAAGARGPVSGSLEAFVKTPNRVPMADTVLPEVAEGVRLPVERPTNQSQSGGLAVQAVGSLDIPAPALRAYRNAEAIMRSEAPSCRLTWEVLAGIGRVESDHGRFAGAVVGDDGVSTPQIYGVALNGVGDVAAISDSDGGSLDGDQVWDRAVGPMQFLPTTWELVSVDGDSDGVANPHDLDDAALAAAVYLCAGGIDLGDREQLRTALWRYNPSEEYVALVLSYIDAYREGDAYPVTVSTTDSTTSTDSTTPTDTTQPNQGPPTDQPTQNGQPDDPSGPPADDPGDLDGPGGDGGGSEPPDGPENPNDPDGDGGGNNGGGDPIPGEEPPGQPEPPEEPPEPEPVLTTLSGTLTTPDDGATWQLDDGTKLDFGSAEHLQNDAPAADFDGDTVVEATVLDELTGLIDKPVTLEVELRDDGTALVYTIGQWDYRPSDGSPAPWDPAAPTS
jgi:hypothetical protein